MAISTPAQNPRGEASSTRFCPDTGISWRLSRRLGTRGTGRLTAGRADTTAEGVLETIYSLAGVTPPQESEQIFRGHPLAVPPRRAGTVFYGIWPALAIAGFVFHRRRQA